MSACALSPSASAVLGGRGARLTTARTTRRSAAPASGRRLMCIAGAKKKVFIDGEVGTTGIQVRDRLANRSDIEIISLVGDDRKDPVKRAKFLNAADAAILCLPDDAAIEGKATAMDGPSHATPTLLYCNSQSAIQSISLTSPVPSEFESSRGFNRGAVRAIKQPTRTCGWVVWVGGWVCVLEPPRAPHNLLHTFAIRHDTFHPSLLSPPPPPPERPRPSACVDTTKYHVRTRACECACVTEQIGPEHITEHPSCSRRAGHQPQHGHHRRLHRAPRRRGMGIRVG
jgi:hypothetical protein